MEEIIFKSEYLCELGHFNDLMLKFIPGIMAYQAIDNLVILLSEIAEGKERRISVGMNWCQECPGQPCTEDAQRLVREILVKFD